MARRKTRFQRRSRVAVESLLNFDGTDDYIIIPSDSRFDDTINSTSDWAISYVVYPPNGLGSGNRTLFTTRANGGGDGVFGQWASNVQKMTIRINGTSADQTFGDNPNFLLRPGRSAHIVFTYDSTNDIITQYFNGSLNYTGDTSSLGEFGRTGLDVYVGANGVSEYFGGGLAHFNIFNTGMTEEHAHLLTRNPAYIPEELRSYVIYDLPLNQRSYPYGLDHTNAIESFVGSGSTVLTNDPLDLSNDNYSIRFWQKSNVASMTSGIELFAGTGTTGFVNDIITQSGRFLRYFLRANESTGRIADFRSDFNNPETIQDEIHFSGYDKIGNDVNDFNTYFDGDQYGTIIFLSRNSLATGDTISYGDLRFLSDGTTSVDFEMNNIMVFQPELTLAQHKWLYNGGGGNDPRTQEAKKNGIGVAGIDTIGSDGITTLLQRFYPMQDDFDDVVSGFTGSSSGGSIITTFDYDEQPSRSFDNVEQYNYAKPTTGDTLQSLHSAIQGKTSDEVVTGNTAIIDFYDQENQFIPPTGDTPTQAILLDGTNHYLELPTSSADFDPSTPSGFTIVVAHRLLTDRVFDSGFSDAFVTLGQGNTDSMFYLGAGNTKAYDCRVRVSPNPVSSANTPNIDNQTTDTFLIATWSVGVIPTSPTQQRHRSFLNGNKFDEFDTAGNTAILDISGIDQTARSLQIGQDRNFTTRRFNGYISFVAIFSEPKTDEFIKDNFTSVNSLKDTTDLVGYWVFNEGNIISGSTEPELVNLAPADNFPVGSATTPSDWNLEFKGYSGGSVSDRRDDVISRLTNINELK